MFIVIFIIYTFYCGLLQTLLLNQINAKNNVHFEHQLEHLFIFCADLFIAPFALLQLFTFVSAAVAEKARQSFERGRTKYC